jgi:hypothetical protein
MEHVIATVKSHLAAFLAEKEAIEEHDAYDAHVWPTPTTHAALEVHWDNVGRLRRACTETRRQRKLTWRELAVALGSCDKNALMEALDSCDKNALMEALERAKYNTDDDDD